MQEKQYMVAVLPKDERLYPEQTETVSDYDEAFQLLNEYLSSYTEQVFHRPRKEKPVRVSLEHAYVELWIITRTNELLTD